MEPFTIIRNGTHKYIQFLGNIVPDVLSAGDTVKINNSPATTLVLSGYYKLEIGDKNIPYLQRIDSGLGKVNSTEQVLFVNNLCDSHNMSNEYEVIIPVSGQYFYKQNSKTRLEYFEAGESLRHPLDFLVKRQ